jgi:hypothetical protein
MAQSTSPATTKSIQQARLILQDPRAWDEAQAPVLRLTNEVGSNSESGLEQDATRQTWTALQLKPEEIVAQRVQLQEANAKAIAANNQALTARGDLAQVQAKLEHLQDTRWQHPAVYVTGAALLGVGCLWLLERKKRIAAQEHAALFLNDALSVLDKPEWLPSVLLDSERRALINEQPGHESTLNPVSGSEALQDSRLLKVPSDALQAPFETVKPWWKRWSRKQRPHTVASESLESGLAHPTTQPIDDQIEINLYEEDIEIEDMQAVTEDFSEIEQVNSEVLSQSRVQPVSNEDAMGHLLEIRMAVQTLYALEQPHAAQALLEQHIDAAPNTCAWVYMEYMDLCGKLGQRDAFEVMRKRYRLQFNRLAPYWMEPNASIQGLDSYERPVAELCGTWPMQDQSKTLIATWLLGTLHSRRLFQLPAYHDLLDLYEMLEFYNDNSTVEQDFVPTVSLLDLDYEFAIEVKIDAQSANDALRAVPTVKTGDFAVDFNLTQSVTQPGALTSLPYIPQAASKD